MFAFRMWVATHGPLFQRQWRRDLDDEMREMVAEATGVGRQRIDTTIARFRQTGEYASSIHSDVMTSRHDPVRQTSGPVGIVTDAGFSGGGAIEAGRRRGQGTTKGHHAFRNAARWLKAHSSEFVERAVGRLAAKWS